MKNCILYFSILFVSQMSFAQTTLNAGDLNGQWIATKPGAELTLDIQGSQATIVSLGKTSLTKSLIGGNMYESINYEGNGVWKAQRNSWIYNGVGGNNSASGHWEKGPNLTLTLSKDKNTLSASGHWSYKRVNRVIEDNSSKNETKTVLYEDFEGVNGKLTLAKLSNKAIIVAQMTNTTRDRLATITITREDGIEDIIKLNPNETITKKYDAKKIIISVEYQEFQNTNNQIEVINTIKKIIRKEVTNENGVLKSLGSPSAIGKRG